MNSDDNGIFELTGCLSKCDKYKYSAWPLNDLQHYPAEDYSTAINTLYLRFYVPSGDYELMEQVLFFQVDLDNNLLRLDFILVHGL